MQATAHSLNVMILALATASFALSACLVSMGSLPSLRSFPQRSASSRASLRPIVLSDPNPICLSAGTPILKQSAFIDLPLLLALCDLEVDATAVRVQPRLGVLHLR